MLREKKKNEPLEKNECVEEEKERNDINNSGILMPIFFFKSCMSKLEAWKNRRSIKTKRKGKTLYVNILMKKKRKDIVDVCTKTLF